MFVIGVDAGIERDKDGANSVGGSTLVLTSSARTHLNTVHVPNTHEK